MNASVRTPPPLTVGVLRELFRNLQPWRSAYEEHGLETLTAPDGTEYHLLDVEYLYHCRRLLSPRQREAIELCLVADQREVDVAVAMHVSPTNPVASYATQGLRRLLDMAEQGTLPPTSTPHLAKAAA